MLNIKVAKAYDSPKIKSRQLSKWGDRILRADEAYNIDNFKKTMKNEKRRIEYAKRRFK